LKPTSPLAPEKARPRIAAASSWPRAAAAAWSRSAPSVPLELQFWIARAMAAAASYA